MSSLPSPARNIYGQGYTRKVETQLPERPPSTRRPGATFLNFLEKNFARSTLPSGYPSGKTKGPTKKQYYHSHFFGEPSMIYLPCLIHFFDSLPCAKASLWPGSPPFGRIAREKHFGQKMELLWGAILSLAPLKDKSIF
jgi:hypothetical protein